VINLMRMAQGSISLLAQQIRRQKMFSGVRPSMT
jgi:hypothetical protein